MLSFLCDTNGKEDHLKGQEHVLAVIMQIWCVAAKSLHNALKIDRERLRWALMGDHTKEYGDKAQIWANSFKRFQTIHRDLQAKACYLSTRTKLRFQHHWHTKLLCRDSGRSICWWQVWRSIMFLLWHVECIHVINLLLEHFHDCWTHSVLIKDWLSS